MTFRAFQRHRRSISTHLLTCAASFPSLPASCRAPRPAFMIILCPGNSPSSRRVMAVSKCMRDSLLTGCSGYLIEVVPWMPYSPPSPDSDGTCSTQQAGHSLSWQGTIGMRLVADMHD
ncbi:hypothetical protein PLICRDRAFT_41407 [Plicaturopsis crispa FD-325 SS-3]|nr:hypothetical protein PLICRDRAFT_41407 [Plicaturopsis crispa FD-325 SS-3]